MADMEQKEIIKNVHKQLRFITEMIEENDVWLYNIYRVAMERLSDDLTVNRVTEDSLENIRQLLHLADSSTANMSIHGVQEKNLVDGEKVFGYLYSVIDMLHDLIVYPDTEYDKG